MKQSIYNLAAEIASIAAENVPREQHQSVFIKAFIDALKMLRNNTEPVHEGNL